MTTEYVTLPAPPPPGVLAQVCAAGTEAGALITSQRGEDLWGRPRVVLALTHPDAAGVAQARQAVLRECLRLRVRAFVV